MSFYSKLATVFLLFGTTMAAPFDEPSKEIISPEAKLKRDPILNEGVSATKVKRTPGNVYICDGLNWGGNCNVWHVNNNQCLTVVGGFFAGSLGPDPGTGCILYRSEDCTDQYTGAIYNPGTGSLQENGYAPGYGIEYRSIHCWFT
ncbi:hypothetical protein TWF694_001968 [Orbilia ellipsospora]|uniref:Uncharacterized protein n=1 Tax=Orbilia ellipsospora TaxID=2528407 RepID=A0AAV9X5L0_9PEZI